MAHEMLTDEQISDFKDAFALFDQGIQFEEILEKKIKIIFNKNIKWA